MHISRLTKIHLLKRGKKFLKLTNLAKLKWPINRAVTIALIGEGGAYIFIFMFYPTNFY